jgi:hypothetical protein
LTERELLKEALADGVELHHRTLHAAGIRSLVAELAGEEAAAPDPRHEPLLEAAE